MKGIKMECLDVEKNKLFAQKNPTRRDRLDSALDHLNSLLGLPKGTIHGYHAYGGVLLQGDSQRGGVVDIYGVNRTTDPKMTDVVQQCISVIEFAQRYKKGDS